jgi:hypothetical protein
MKVPSVPWKNIAAIGGTIRIQGRQDQTNATLLHRLAGQAALRRRAKNQLRTCRFHPEGFGHAEHHGQGDTCQRSQDCHGEQRTFAMEQPSLEQLLRLLQQQTEDEQWAKANEKRDCYLIQQQH